jgi:hypothetical protein
MKPKLENTLFTLWNILEDHRVWWLWLQLYYGGGTLLKERWENISQYKLRDAARTSLPAFMACMASKVPVSDPDPKIAQCEMPLRRAINLVEGVDNIACMAILGRMIDDIGDALMEPPEPPAPPTPSGPPKPKPNTRPPPAQQQQEDEGEEEEDEEEETPAPRKPSPIKSKPKANPQQEQTKKNQARRAG